MRFWNYVHSRCGRKYIQDNLLLLLRGNTDLPPPHLRLVDQAKPDLAGGGVGGARVTLFSGDRVPCPGGRVIGGVKCKVTLSKGREGLVHNCEGPLAQRLHKLTLSRGREVGSAWPTHSFLLWTESHPGVNTLPYLVLRTWSVTTYLQNSSNYECFDFMKWFTAVTPGREHPMLE